MRREKLAGLVAQLAIDRPERHALLGDLMDQSAASASSLREDTYQRAADTRDFVCETVAALSRRKPMVLLIEDAHWIDQVSNDLIQATITKYADARLALIVTHRPNYAPAWVRSGSVTAITLQPLSRDATDAMIASYLGTEGIPQELKASSTAGPKATPCSWRKRSAFCVRATTSRSRTVASALWRPARIRCCPATCSTWS